MRSRVRTTALVSRAVGRRVQRSSVDMANEQRKRGKNIDSQAREMIANVYHFLKEEYDFMKQNNLDNCDLSLLANVRKRTAKATGVSERTVTKVLKEKRDSAFTSTNDTETTKKAAKENKPAKKILQISEEMNKDEETSSSSSSSQELRINVRSTTELFPTSKSSTLQQTVPDKPEHILEYTNRSLPESLEPVPQWNAHEWHTTEDLITLKSNTEYIG